MIQRKNFLFIMAFSFNLLMSTAGCQKAQPKGEKDSMARTDTFDATTQANLDQWLDGPYDTESKAEVRRLLNEDPQGAVDAFFTSLSFGTGGLRGIVGVGTNRMNRYTIMKATQGLANYLHEHALDTHKTSVVIGYDSRIHSRPFTEEAARVLAGNGIDVYVFEELRPTPQISFACRELGCSAAIIVTASHNPPEYNGYKVYWEDGGQIVPPHDSGIIEQVRAITDLNQIKQAPLDDAHIHWIGQEMDAKYLAMADKLQHYPEDNRTSGSKLKIVYTGLHGTGVKVIPECLNRWGFTDVTLVEEQCIPDGNFPTVKSPNPEDPIALKRGVAVLNEIEGDILLANDPDADRLACAVRHDGEIVYLSGNQLGSICLEHVCNALKTQGRLPSNGAVVKTVVTTELFHQIAQSYNIPCFDVLTGFKYIAALIHKWETLGPNYKYLFGGEESFGYLLGDTVRDKDGVTSSALVAEVALQAKLQGKTLVDLLNELYERHGVYRESLISVQYGEGKADRARMVDAMERLRKAPPKTLRGQRVLHYDDFLTSMRTNAQSGKQEHIELPEANVFRITMEDGSKVVVRPSGTEPKVKLYGGTVKALDGDITSVASECDKNLASLLDAVSDVLQGKA